MINYYISLTLNFKKCFSHFAKTANLMFVELRTQYISSLKFSLLCNKINNSGAILFIIFAEDTKTIQEIIKEKSYSVCHSVSIYLFNKIVIKDRKKERTFLVFDEISFSEQY